MSGGFKPNIPHSAIWVPMWVKDAFFAIGWFAIDPVMIKTLDGQELILMKWCSDGDPRYPTR